MNSDDMETGEPIESASQRTPARLHSDVAAASTCVSSSSSCAEAATRYAPAASSIERRPHAVPCTAVQIQERNNIENSGLRIVMIHNAGESRLALICAKFPRRRATAC